MLKRNKFTAAVVVVCTGVIFVLFSKSYFSPHGVVSLSAKIAPRSLGSPEAKVKIVEFMDMQCQTCAEVSPLMKNYLYTYPSKIYWQVKFYPLVKPHLYALKSAIYAECAARQNKFWPFYDALLGSQSEWAEATDPDAIFERLASDTGLDVNALKGCVEAGDAKRVVMNEKAEAMGAGIQSTPTFFVNGKRVVGPKALQEELDKMLRSLVE